MLVIIKKKRGFDSRYKFSGKELDDETGYNYFGARYYDSDLSNWISVDAASDKYPNLSPYMYCAGNPIKAIDPNGKGIKPVNEDASILMEYAFSSYNATSNQFKSALKIQNVDGVFRSSLGEMNQKDFENHMIKAYKKEGLKWDKENTEKAFNLYSKIQEKEVTEIAVYDKGTKSSTFEMGTKGTTEVKGIPISTNSNYDNFENAFNKNKDVLDEVNGYGILKYEQEPGSDMDESKFHKGTIIINATGETHAIESLSTLNKIMEETK